MELARNPSELLYNGTTADEEAEFPQALRLSLFVNGLFMTCLSFITVPANGLLFLTLYIDPLKRLRARSSIFVMSLSMANFLVGLFVEPTYGFLHLYEGYRGAIPPKADTLYSVGRTFAALANNASFFTVCALAIDQYLAVSRPIEYRAAEQQKDKSRTAFVFISVIWTYSVASALLPFIGVSEDVFYKLDLHVNSSTTLILLLLSYVALANSYHKRELRRRPEAYSPFRDKALLGVIFLLVVVASTTSLPIITYWHVYDYCVPCRSNEGFQLLSRVVECVFYLKFSVDPFLYAWRLPRYRQAFRLVFHCTFTAR